MVKGLTQELTWEGDKLPELVGSYLSNVDGTVNSVHCDVVWIVKTLQNGNHYSQPPLPWEQSKRLV